MISFPCDQTPHLTWPDVTWLFFHLFGKSCRADSSTICMVKTAKQFTHLTGSAVDTQSSLIIITQLTELYRFYRLPLPSDFLQVTPSASDQVRGLMSNFILHPHEHLLLLLCSRLCSSLSHSVKPCQVVGFTGLWMSLCYALSGASWHGPGVPPVRVHLHAHTIGHVSCHNPQPRFTVQL